LIGTRIICSSGALARGRSAVAADGAAACAAMAESLPPHPKQLSFPRPTAEVVTDGADSARNLSHSAKKSSKLFATQFVFLPPLASLLNKMSDAEL